MLLGAALAAGCSGAADLRRAEDALERARLAGAEAKAPYEYFSAREYYELAVREREEADHEQAKVFAAESLKYSTEAIAKSRRKGK